MDKESSTDVLQTQIDENKALLLSERAVHEAEIMELKDQLNSVED
jgi:hypothetical protein